MPAGAPLNNKNAEKFKTEKEYTDFLLLNSKHWVKSFWDIDAESVEREWRLGIKKRFGGEKARVDIRVILSDGRNIGIEVKNPKQKFHELSRSVSQLLSYAVLAKDNGFPFDELAIITSENDSIAIEIIKMFDLPIRVFLITKEIHGEFQR